MTSDPAGSRPLGAGFALVATVLIAINLRPGASAIGPVLEELVSDLGMGPTAMGLLTSLPGLCFGLVGALAVAFARRVGMTQGICLGVVAVVVGLLARAAVDDAWLFLALTTVALAGMAVANVLVPAWIKRHARDGGVRLMTAYSTGLTLGGAIAAAVAAPISAASHLGWRAALGVWGMIALVALVPWIVIAGRDRKLVIGRAPSTPTGAPVWRSPTTLGLALLLGIQSMNAYIQFGYLPQIYRDAGLSPGLAGLYMSLLTALGVLGSLVMPTVIARSPNLTSWMLSFGALLVIGNAGLLLAPGTVPWLWAVILGVSGFAFPTAITLITARTRDPAVTARVSGFVQPVGYMLAAIGPFVVGMIHDATGDWDLVLVLLTISGVVLALAGLRVARPVMVDDELAT